MRDKNRNLAAALDYAAFGWHVIPLHTPLPSGGCSCRNPDCQGAGKHPRIKKWDQNATIDPEQIRRWWKQWPNANIGIACGPSKLTVIDLDVTEAEDGRDTWHELKAQHGIDDSGALINLTGGGGEQLIFATPKGHRINNNSRTLGPGIDTRGVGGLFVAPPSLHASGNRYVWDAAYHPREHKPVPMPSPLVKLLTRGGRERQSVAPPVTDIIPKGQRNDRLLSLAGSMRHRGMVETEIAAALIAVNRGRCDPPLDEAEVRQIAASAGRYTPGTQGRDASSAGRGGRRALTDLGNAERLVDRHGGELHYCRAWNEWLIWNGQRWVTDASGKVDQMAKDTVREIRREAAGISNEGARQAIIRHATRSEGNLRIKAMLERAQSEPGIPVEPKDLDADPWLLNCNNGTLDLRTGELYPHRPEDLITRLAPVDYDPNATLSLWDRFLEDVTDPAVAHFLQLAVGYTLTGDTREEKFFFVHGPTSTGKSTFLEAIKTTLGDYSMTADFESFLKRSFTGGPRPDIARLAHPRFVVSIEVDHGKELAEGLVKQMTGGDTMTARFLYAREFEFKPKFKLWLAANDAPRISHGDEAMWRRILRVPFEKTIPKERRDPTLKARLRDSKLAGPAILAWAVHGCLEWQKRGLPACPEVEQATKNLREQMDTVGEFIDECCILQPDAWIDTATIRKEYEAWCRERGEMPANGRRWAEGLKEHGCIPKMRRRQGEPTRGWVGIGLLGDEADGLSAGAVNTLTAVNGSFQKSDPWPSCAETSPVETFPKVPYTGVNALTGNGDRERVTL